MGPTPIGPPPIGPPHPAAPLAPRDVAPLMVTVTEPGAATRSCCMANSVAAARLETPAFA